MILLTGATGFLGRHTLGTLLAHNWIVRPLVRSEAKYRDIFPRGPGPLVADLIQLKRGDLLAEKIGELVHIASEVWPVQRKNPAEFDITNIRGARALLDSLDHRAITRIVLASTFSVYGSPRGPVNEDFDARPENEYAQSKMVQENLFREYGARHDIPVAILRFTSIYGPGQNPDTVLARFFAAALQNRTLTITGPPARLQNFIYVADAASAIAAALDRSANGNFNIASESETTLRDLAATVLRVTGARARAIERPDPAEKPAPGSFHVEIGKAVRELGWRPRYDLESGLRAMLPQPPEL